MQLRSRLRVSSEACEGWWSKREQYLWHHQRQSLALPTVSVGLPQVPLHPCTCDGLLSFPSVKVASAAVCFVSLYTEQLWRKNVSHLHQPKGSAACLSIRDTLGDGGGAGAFDLLSASHLGRRWQARGGPTVPYRLLTYE